MSAFSRFITNWNARHENERARSQSRAFFFMGDGKSPETGSIAAEVVRRRAVLAALAASRQAWQATWRVAVTRASAASRTRAVSARLAITKEKPWNDPRLVS